MPALHTDDALDLATADAILPLALWAPTSLDPQDPRAMRAQLTLELERNVWTPYSRFDPKSYMPYASIHLWENPLLQASIGLHLIRGKNASDRNNHQLAAR